MSFPTHQPEIPERETGWFKQTTDHAKAWFSEHRRVGFHWLALLTAIAVLSLDAWFIGLVALAWTHAVPAYKWYRGTGRATKQKRSKKGRIAIFAVTAGLFAWMCVDEGWEMALILLVLLGIVARLSLKRDWTLLGAIIIGVLMGGEYGNGVSIGIALFASALVEYERRKAAYAAKQARMANRVAEYDLPRRPVTESGPTGGRLSDRLTDPATDVHPTDYRDDRRDQTGVFVTEARTEDPYGDYPPRPAHLPFPGGREEETGEHPGKAFGMTDPRERRPQWASGEEHPTGTYPVQPGGASETPRDETGHHTTVFRVPEQQDGPPVHRRRVPPPEGGVPQQG